MRHRVLDRFLCVARRPLHRHRHRAGERGPPRLALPRAALRARRRGGRGGGRAPRSRDRARRGRRAQRDAAARALPRRARLGRARARAAQAHDGALEPASRAAALPQSLAGAPARAGPCAARRGVRPRRRHEQAARLPPARLSPAVPRLVVLDALGLTYRAYYAFIGRPLKNRRGENTSAIFGMANMLVRFRRELKPDRWALAWDGPGPTFRHERYREYKAPRPPMPDDLRSQLSPIEDLARCLRLPVLEKPGMEADDVMATLARLGAGAGYEVLLVTDRTST